MKYYVLEPLSDEPYYLLEENNNSVDDAICSKCGFIKSTKHISKLHLKYTPDNVVLNFVNRTFIGVIRTDLLRILNISEINKFIELIDLYNSEGQILENFKGFCGKNIIYTRGDKNSKLLTCENCKRYIYLMRGKLYISSALPIDISIFINQLNCLVINETLYNNLKGKKFKKLNIRKLDLLEHPKDGHIFKDLYIV